MYGTTTDAMALTHTICRGADDDFIYFANSGIAGDLSSLRSYLASNPLQVCYELATPLTFNLTPAQLNLLSSTNILTTNAKDLTVRYYATGQQGNVEGNIAFLLGETASNASAITALSESVAPIETGTATQPYVVGDYLLLNGQFCKVTAAIATGETITVGTNVAETSVGDEISSLNNLYVNNAVVKQSLDMTWTIQSFTADSDGLYSVVASNDSTATTVAVSVALDPQMSVVISQVADYSANAQVSSPFIPLKAGKTIYCRATGSGTGSVIKLS